MSSNIVLLASLGEEEAPVAEKMALIEQLPFYFRPILEFQQLMIAHGWGYDLAEQVSGLILQNFFVQTCDEDTISQYEKLFGLLPEAGDTMEYRRERVLQIFSSTTPFDINYLDSKLQELFGTEYAMDVYPVSSELYVLLQSERYGAINLLYDLLLSIVPAHIKIFANQEVKNFINRPLYVGAVPGAAIHRII